MVFKAEFEQIFPFVNTFMFSPPFFLLVNYFVLIGLFVSCPMQFYDKFDIRHNIAELLEYLWQVPSHCNAWRQVKYFSGFYLLHYSFGIEYPFL